MSNKLKEHQVPTVRAVAGQIHVGLVAVLVLVLEWPDWEMPARFITGFQTTGTLELSHIYDQATPPEPRRIGEVLAEAPKLLASMQNWPVDPEVDFIWQSAIKERDNG